MKVWMASCAALMVFVSASLRADVTISQTVTMEGGVLATIGQSLTPRVVLRVKGGKARIETEANGATVISLADATGRVVVLNPAEKTARVLEPAAAAAGPSPVTPTPEMSIKPIGRTRTIDGAQCDDYAIATTLNMGEMLGTPAQVPPEAAAAMKDVQMVLNGTSCISRTGPGIAEYMEFQKKAAAMITTMIGSLGGGANNGPLQRVLGAAGDVPGLARLTEVTMAVEGATQFALFMQQAGPMKLTIKVTAVSTDPIVDELFNVPPDYKIVK